MSGIFGIYHPDSLPINPAHLEQMAQSCAHRGPDRTHIVQQQHIGFGHCMLQTTPESVYEQLPFNDPESGLVITSDARIDNREELANKLGLHKLSEIPDSQLILIAYKKWGIESFAHLIGDFSFVIWDPDNQQLVCVRDIAGVKPFYYHHSASQFLFSSEVKQLAEHTEVLLKINECMIAEYLSFSFCSKTETLFSDIYRLAPAHYLVLRQEKIEINNYWAWQPKGYLRYKKTSEYTEHFLELFKKSVESRLRCNDRICAELSGGLDSSMIVGMASNLLKKQNKYLLPTYSLIFSGHPFDEKAYIDEVVRHNNVLARYIEYDEHIFLAWKDQVLHSFEPPDFPNLSVNNPLLSMIKRNDSRVILSGVGGDQCLTGSGYPYLDYLLNGKFSDLFNELLFHFNRNKWHALKKLGINLLWPFIPLQIRYILTEHAAKKHIPKWLEKNFANRTQIIERIHKTDSRLRRKNLGGAGQANMFTGAGNQFFLETLDRQRAFWKTENRYPFLDKRILEFTMSIPDHEKQKCGQIKFLLRDQCNHILPDFIRERTTKAEFSFLFSQAFAHSLFLLESQEDFFYKTNWIDREIFQKYILLKKSIINNNIYTVGHRTWELWFAFAINLWYQELNK